jgi:hypothetical protein
MQYPQLLDRSDAATQCLRLFLSQTCTLRVPGAIVHRFHGSCVCRYVAIFLEAQDLFDGTVTPAPT